VATVPPWRCPKATHSAAAPTRSCAETKLALAKNVRTTRTLQNDEIRMTKLERMTNDQMPLWRQPCRLRSLVSQATRLPLQFVRHSCFVISAVAILMLIAQVCSIAMAQAQSPTVIGKWNVQISFGDGSQRALGFDAEDGGKGTLLVLDPKLKVWGPGKPSEAKWTREDQNSVTFTGPVEFMLGNVGRDAGMLICKGKFESADSITGEVEFAPLVGERSSKHGTFKATRTQ
jgi:hypothetical protein